MSDWWKSLTLEEKKDYLKQHPRSKKKISTNRNPTNSRSRVGKPLSNPEKERAVKYLQINGYDTKRVISSSLDDLQRNFERKIDKLENKQVKDLYNKTVKTVKQDVGKASGVISQTLSIAGITLLISVPLALIIGAPIAATIPLVIVGFGDDIKKHTDKVEAELHAIEEEDNRRDFENKEAEIKFKMEQAERKRQAKIAYLKRVHEDMMKKAKENLNDPEKVVNSLVKTDESKEEIKPETSNLKSIVNSVIRSSNLKNTSMKDKISINSSHETDLLKALIKLEKADVSTNEISSYEELLEHIDYLENCIPTAATIMVASIGKPSMLSRSKLMLNKCNKELAVAKTYLNKVAETANIKKSSIDFFLKKNLKPKQYRFEKAYVRDGNNTLVCEHHILNDVETANCTHNKIEIYSFVTGNNNINISLVKNSNFMPKSFSVIKPRELSSWLKEHV